MPASRFAFSRPSRSAASSASAVSGGAKRIPKPTSPFPDFQWRHLDLPSRLIPSTRPITRHVVPGSTQHVVIVGAGLAGLSAALRLRAAGRDVTVIEASGTVGGRCRTESLTSAHGTFEADTGATVLTMPELINSAIAGVGYVANPKPGQTPAPCIWQPRRLSPAYRGEFAGSGAYAEVFPDADRMATEIRRFAASKGQSDVEQTALVNGYMKHRAWSQEIFSASFEHFIAADFDGVADLISTPASATSLGHLATLGAFGKLGRTTARHIPDEELQRLFTFQALYAGESPAKALAVYATIGHMDTTMGVFYPGHAIGEAPEVMAAAARAAGVMFKMNQRIDHFILSEDRITAVVTSDGERIPADAVIATPDLPVVADILGRSGSEGFQAPNASRPAAAMSPTPPRLAAHSLARRLWRKVAGLRWSPSAVVVHGSIPLEISQRWASPRHHTISFGEAWEQTFIEITDPRKGHGRVMSDPSLLITRPARSAPTRLFHSQDARVCEPVSILAPAPNLHSAAIDWPRVGGPYVAELLATLESRGYHGISEHLEIARADTPTTWLERDQFPAGTPFALAHTFTQTGPFRPRNARAFGVENLVLAGSSTTPGVGVPTVVLSGALAARRITGAGVR